MQKIYVSLHRFHASLSRGMELNAGARSTIFLVRHGECMGNVVRKNLHPNESILTDNGKLQAKLLGEALKNEKFTAALASDYPRAFETAEIVLSESICPHAPLQISTKLRERHVGIYEGGDYTKLVVDAVKSGQLLDWIPEGGESTTDVENRIENFLQDIFDIVDTSQEAHTILAVTHSGFLFHLVHYLPKLPNKYTLKNWLPEYNKVCPNTGYFQISIEKNPAPNVPRELEVITAHGIEHLSELGPDALHKFTLENEKMKAFKGCVQQ